MCIYIYSPEVECSDPPQILHTHVVSNGNITGSKAIYQCIQGYTSVLGVYVRVCTDMTDTTDVTHMGTLQADTGQEIVCQSMYDF